MQLGDIQQEMHKIVKRNIYDAECPASEEIYKMTCDHEERPMAVISEDGRLGVANSSQPIF